MEIITAILTSLLAIASPIGVIVDQLAEEAILDQIAGAEELYVRLDNVPTYQIINGRVEHVRAAGRGVYPIPELRIAAVDIESEPIDVDLRSLQRGELVLDAPAQAALKLALEAEDLNNFLASDRVQQFLDGLRFSLPGQNTARGINRYGLENPSLRFLEGDRLRVAVDLQDRVLEENVAITVELGLAIVNGHRLELIEPVIIANNEPVPNQLIRSFVDGLQPQLTLRQLENLGITARVLSFEIRDNELDIAVFARVEPDSPFLTRRSQTDASETPLPSASPQP